MHELHYLLCYKTAFALRHMYSASVLSFAGLVYQALGFPPQFFTVLFAIPRVTGYLAHWRESLSDPDTKILRPQQDYRVRCSHTFSRATYTQLSGLNVLLLKCYCAARICVTCPDQLSRYESKNSALTCACMKGLTYMHTATGHDLSL